MSYDIHLVDPVTHTVLELDDPHQIRGGTYALSGTREMWLNITYNYSEWYYKPGVFPGGEDGKGIRSIYGLSGAESIPVLQAAIKALEAMTEDLTPEKIKEYEDYGAGGYWTPTRANAIRPLYQLLALAKLRPDGLWEGD